MKKVLWGIQILLAVVFLLHGYVLTNPPEAMQANFEALPFSRNFMAFIGIAEVLGGFGLILPRALSIMPFLTPLAAALLAVIMVGAVVVHVMSGEIAQALPSFIITVLSVFIAYMLSKGNFVKQRI
jgi:uncharacterized membrane protein YphA (DoxX/SURF4 family)